MFSAGLPCLAIGGYPSLCELVRDGENGRSFATSEELASQITEVLTGYQDGGKFLSLYRKNLEKFKEKTWQK